MRKGFTLIELLAVICILGIIATLIVINVIGTINKTKSSLSSTQISTIEKAAEKWGVVNADKMPLDDSLYDVSIDTLSDDGFLDSSLLQNPKDGLRLCGVVRIKYNDSKKQYSYNFVKQNCL